MKPKIDIVPFGGLGNRLRVINSAVSLKENITFKLELIWIEKAELQVPFFNLFKSIGVEFNLSKGLKYLFFRHFIKHVYIQKYTSFYKLVLSLFYDLVLFDNDIKNITPKKLQNVINGKSNILIATCFPFYPFDSYDNLILSESLKDELRSVQLPEKTIGVHIRRTDHIDIIKSSSLQDYELAIKKEILDNEHATFFLASDDIDVKNHFKEKFGERMFVQSIDLSRANAVGVESALVEIYLLSLCSKLICNSHSSFVATAQMLNQKKEIIEV